MLLTLLKNSNIMVFLIYSTGIVAKTKSYKLIILYLKHLPVVSAEYQQLLTDLFTIMYAWFTY